MARRPSKRQATPDYHAELSDDDDELDMPSRLSTPLGGPASDRYQHGRRDEEPELSD